MVLYLLFHCKALLSSPHNHTMFSVGLHGTNWGEGTESKARCQYLIGISDPATGVVKLHSVDHVFALAMQVLGGGNDDESNVKLGESVRGDRERNALVMEFGR